MADEQPPPNAALRAILAKAIAAVLDASYDAMARAPVDSPECMLVVDTLDDCLDELRDVQEKISGK